MLTLVTLVILLICSIYGQQNITVNTILGYVIGKQMDDGFVLFKGIPYTENAPIGDLRFTESVVKTSGFQTDPAFKNLINKVKRMNQHSTKIYMYF